MIAFIKGQRAILFLFKKTTQNQSYVCVKNISNDVLEIEITRTILGLYRKTPFYILISFILR